MKKINNKKINTFIRRHIKLTSVFMTVVIAFMFGISTAALAADPTSVGGVLELGKSVDFYAGFIVGAPIGYGFAQRTIVLSLKEQVDSMKTDLAEWEEIKKAAFEEKMNKGRHHE